MMINKLSPGKMCIPGVTVRVSKRIEFVIKSVNNLKTAWHKNHLDCQQV